MKKLNSWINNGSDAAPHYDFLPPKEWSSERIKVEYQSIVDAIETVKVQENGDYSANWLELILRLPESLQSMLLVELKAGNKICSVSIEGWPNLASIVIVLNHNFLQKSKISSANIHWREIDDPHYCREEISQIYNGTEYLLLA